VNKQKYSIREMAANFSSSENRVWVQAAFLLFSSAFLLVLMFTLEIPDIVYGGEDKAFHYIAGKLISSIIFYIFYFCIIVRLLLIVKDNGSMTRVLLWIPPVIVGVLIVAVCVSAIAAFLKEFYDLGGLGTFDFLDIQMTFEGAVSIVYPVAAIMAVTPFCIPLDIQMQLPRLVLSDVSKGVQSIDCYFRKGKLHFQPGKYTDVLILESDMECVSELICFFKGLDLSCGHVATISEADLFFSDSRSAISVFVFANFVKVVDPERGLTGSEFLDELSNKYASEKFPFLTIMISDYSRFLDPDKVLPDLVLQKPFDEKQLQAFLMDKGIV